MKKHLIWLPLALIVVILGRSFKEQSGHDLDVETAHELRRAIQSYEDEFGGMESMSSTEIIQSLSGKNPRNRMFYDSKRETNMRLVDGEFVCKSGKKIFVFFSDKRILLAIINSEDDYSGMPYAVPSTDTIRCVVANRTIR